MASFSSETLAALVGSKSQRRHMCHSPRSWAQSTSTASSHLWTASQRSQKSRKPRSRRLPLATPSMQITRMTWHQQWAPCCSRAPSLPRAGTRSSCRCTRPTTRSRRASSASWRGSAQSTPAATPSRWGCRGPRRTPSTRSSSPTRSPAAGRSSSTRASRSTSRARRSTSPCRCWGRCTATPCRRGTCTGSATRPAPPCSGTTGRSGTAP
mmetsp:Transcript_55484/g.156165  ORF Transcript_55484/g.156165 Transcript_55484/m.156165 type:complete len:210 (+) Transcript_55484:190-819(+)